MKKLYLMSLVALLIITGFLALSFKYYQVNHSTNTVLASTKEPEREIIFQTQADLDNDGKKERIVLDEVKGYEDPFGVYSRVLIYKGNELVYNSKEAGLAIAGTYFEDPRELIRIGDLNKNGIPEIYLIEDGSGGNSQILTIIEKVKTKYTVLYHSMIYNYRYEDFDNDGSLEFYGVTDDFIGDPSYKKETIFKIANGKYIPSYKLTRQYVEREFEKLKQEININGNFGNFRYLTSYYAVLGLKEEGIEFIKKSWNFSKPEQQEQYIKEFEQSIKGWEKWWNSLK
jgi:hypothetical protein